MSTNSAHQWHNVTGGELKCFQCQMIYNPKLPSAKCFGKLPPEEILLQMREILNCWHEDLNLARKDDDCKIVLNTIHAMFAGKKV